MFGPDADAFNPERWLDQGRSKAMDSFMIPVFKHLPLPLSLRFVRSRTYELKKNNEPHLN